MYTNGNISQLLWKGKNEGSYSRGLSFSYDGVNRLTGSSGLGGYGDIENGITYDRNGNIKTLNRSGSVVDQLVYGYHGNQLTTLTDYSGNALGTQSGSYLYDDNGNMTSDGPRGAMITYNYLNLPQRVTRAGQTYDYSYDARGNKHRYTTPGGVTKYAGGFEYAGTNVLKRVGLASGQAVVSDSVRFQYYLKDHLGNVRLVFDEKGTILQQTDYYPFGLDIARQPGMN